MIIVFALIGVAMIMIAGTRDVLDTPDSKNYESMFYSSGKMDISEDFREPTFMIMASTLNSLGLGINALFFAYAILSIPIRLGAIWKMSKLPLLTLSIYISFYYQLHDLVQIRCAVASALFIMAVYLHSKQQEKYAALCIIIGFFFHFSAVVGIVIFLFGNKPLKTWQAVAMGIVVVASICIYFVGLDISQLIPDELGGSRLQAYRELKEKGIEGDLEGVAFYKNPMVLTNLCLFYFCLFYHKYLTDQNHYLPLLLKIMMVAFICCLTLGNLSSVVASRLFEFFDIVSIFLWTTVIYVFNPIYVGKIFTNAVSTARILYSVLIYTLQL